MVTCETWIRSCKSMLVCVSPVRGPQVYRLTRVPSAGSVSAPEACAQAQWKSRLNLLFTLLERCDGTDHAPPGLRLRSHDHALPEERSCFLNASCANARRRVQGPGDVKCGAKLPSQRREWRKPCLSLFSGSNFWQALLTCTDKHYGGQRKEKQVRTECRDNRRELFRVTERLRQFLRGQIGEGQK